MRPTRTKPATFMQEEERNNTLFFGNLTLQEVKNEEGEELKNLELQHKKTNELIAQELGTNYSETNLLEDAILINRKAIEDDKGKEITPAYNNGRYTSAEHRDTIYEDITDVNKLDNLMMEFNSVDFDSKEDLLNKIEELKEKVKKILNEKHFLDNTSLEQKLVVLHTATFLKSTEDLINKEFDRKKILIGQETQTDQIIKEEIDSTFEMFLTEEEISALSTKDKIQYLHSKKKELTSNNPNKINLKKLDNTINSLINSKKEVVQEKTIKEEIEGISKKFSTKRVKRDIVELIQEIKEGGDISEIKEKSKKGTLSAILILLALYGVYQLIIPNPTNDMSIEEINALIVEAEESERHYQPIDENEEPTTWDLDLEEEGIEDIVKELEQIKDSDYFTDIIEHLNKNEELVHEWDANYFKITKIPGPNGDEYQVTDNVNFISIEEFRKQSLLVLIKEGGVNLEGIIKEPQGKEKLEELLNLPYLQEETKQSIKEILESQ